MERRGLDGLNQLQQFVNEISHRPGFLFTGCPEQNELRKRFRKTACRSGSYSQTYPRSARMISLARRFRPEPVPQNSRRRVHVACSVLDGFPVGLFGSRRQKPLQRRLDGFQLPECQGLQCSLLRVQSVAAP